MIIAKAFLVLMVLNKGSIEKIPMSSFSYCEREAKRVEKVINKGFFNMSIKVYCVKTGDL